jgi:hypothetical protein
MTFVAMCMQLGAIAYEILSGQLPHPRLKTSTLFEALSIVRDEQPIPLQQRNSATRGDLATVVMTALAAEPERRYGSAQALRMIFIAFLRIVRSKLASPAPFMSCLALPDGTAH